MPWSGRGGRDPTGVGMFDRFDDYDQGMSSQRWRFPLADRLVAGAMGPVLHGKRLLMRPLRPSDFLAWQEVRRRNTDWLEPWEPQRPPSAPNAVEVRRAFDARCDMRDRDRSTGSAYGFGVFFEDRLVGECNVNNVQRGAMQGGSIGYWIDQAWAGRSLTSEAVVCALGFCFEELGLHRIEIAIIPRNARSLRVVEKLGIRDEGVALRFLEINGVWEDHVRFAITSEEWQDRHGEFFQNWLAPVTT